MALSDFTLTEYGRQWIAKAIEAGTAEGGVTLTRCLWGFTSGSPSGENFDIPPVMDSTWSETTTASVERNNDGCIVHANATNISVVGSPARSNFIEIFGKMDASEITDSVVMFSKSATEESIPAYAVQAVTRQVDVALRLSSAEGITYAPAQSIYATTDYVTEYCHRFDEYALHAFFFSSSGTNKCDVTIYRNGKQIDYVLLESDPISGDDPSPDDAIGIFENYTGTSTKGFIVTGYSSQTHEERTSVYCDYGSAIDVSDDFFADASLWPGASSQLHIIRRKGE